VQHICIKHNTYQNRYKAVLACFDVVITSVFLLLTTDKDYLQLNFTSTLARGNTDSKRQSFPVHTMKANVGSRGIVPAILHLGTAVNCTSRPLYPPESPRYILKRRLGGLQSRSGLLEKSNTSCSYKDSKPGPSSPCSSHYTDYATQEPNIHSSVMFSIKYTLLFCVCLLQNSDYGPLIDVMQFGTHAETFRRNLLSLSSGHSSDIKMEAASSSGTLVPNHQNASCHISEVHKLSIHCSGD